MCLSFLIVVELVHSHSAVYIANKVVEYFALQACPPPPFILVVWNSGSLYIKAIFY